MKHLSRGASIPSKMAARHALGRLKKRTEGLVGGGARRGASGARGGP